MIFGTKTSYKTWQNGLFWRRVTAAFVIIAFTLFDATRYAPQGYASPSVTTVASDPASLSIPKELGSIDEIYRAGTRSSGLGTRETRNENESRTESAALASDKELMRARRATNPESRSEKTIVFIQDAHDSLEAQENMAKIIGLLVKEKGIKTVFEEGYEGPVPTDKFFGFIKDPAVRQKVSYFLLDKLRIGGAEYAHINRTGAFDLIGVEDLKLYGENIESYRDASKSRTDTSEDLRELFTQISNLADRHFPKALKACLKVKERFTEGKLPILNYLKELQTFYPSDRGPAIFIKNYPAVSLLLAAQTARNPELIEQLNALDSSVVFGEIQRLERDISEAYLGTERERRIFTYYQALSLLNRLNRIELTQPEYEAVKEMLRKFETQKLADFIVSLTHRSLVLSKEWERHIKDAVRFYEIALQRDSALAKALDRFFGTSPESRVPSSANAAPAVLVYGGFHANNIKELLRTKGISYAVISPAITGIDKKHQEDYKQLMSVGHYSFEVPFLAARANRPPSTFFEAVTNGEQPVNAELRAIVSSVEALGVYSATPLIEQRLAHSGTVSASEVSRSDRRSEVRERSQDDEAAELFLKQTPILWGELQMKKGDYFNKARLLEVRALSQVFESIASDHPGAYLADILKESQNDPRILKDYVRTSAINQLLRQIDPFTYYSSFLESKIKRPTVLSISKIILNAILHLMMFFQRIFHLNKFPSRNLAYQALIEMVRQWPKKERHTHVSASIPLQMIHDEMASLSSKFQPGYYRTAMKEYIKVQKEKLTGEYAATHGAFLKFLEQFPDEKDISIQALENFMKTSRRGKRELFDVWLDTLGWIVDNAPEAGMRETARQLFQPAFIRVIQNIASQNFADGIYDLELRFNPYKTVGKQLAPEDLKKFLTKLSKALEDTEKEADRALGTDGGIHHKVRFMFSFARERMSGVKWGEGWDKKFEILKELKRTAGETIYAERLRGIDISGVESFSVGKGKQRRIMKEDEIGPFYHLQEVAGHLRELKDSGYIITTHLGDFFAAGPAWDRQGHEAFVRAHLKAFGPIVDRIGHGRIFSPAGKGAVAYTRTGDGDWAWFSANDIDEAFLREVKERGITVESCPDRWMDEIFVLREKYPNYWWSEPDSKIGVVYGTDGLNPEKHVSLSHWMVRLMLASPTPDHPSLGRKKGITVGEIREATRAFSDDGISRSEVREDSLEGSSKRHYEKSRGLFDPAPSFEAFEDFWDWYVKHRSEFLSGINPQEVLHAKTVLQVIAALGKIPSGQQQSFEFDLGAREYAEQSPVIQSAPVMETFDDFWSWYIRYESKLPSRDKAKEFLSATYAVQVLAQAEKIQGHQVEDFKRSAGACEYVEGSDVVREAPSFETFKDFMDWYKTHRHELGYRDNPRETLRAGTVVLILVRAQKISTKKLHEFQRNSSAYDYAQDSPVIQKAPSFGTFETFIRWYKEHRSELISRKDPAEVLGAGTTVLVLVHAGKIPENKLKRFQLNASGYEYAEQSASIQSAPGFEDFDAFLHWYKQHRLELPSRKKGGEFLGAGYASQVLMWAGKIPEKKIQKFLQKAGAYERAVREKDAITGEMRRIWGPGNIKPGKYLAQLKRQFDPDLLLNLKLLPKGIKKPVREDYRELILTFAFREYGGEVLQPWTDSSRSEMRGPTPVEREKSKITDQHIQRMREYFKGMTVPTGPIEQIMRAIESLSEEQFSSSEFKEFYENAEHGIEHSLHVTKKVFEWANQFHFEVDREALAAGAFLHDIKGLDSTGHEQRKNHHEEGAKVAENILRSVGWTDERIGKVKDVIRGHRGVPETYNAENYPDGYANDGQGKPKPDSLGAKLVHDADTYIELENLGRLKSITMDIRWRKNPLNILKGNVDQNFVVRMIRFIQYALFGIFRKLYHKYERFFDEHKWLRFVELCSFTDRFYDSDFYFEKGQEINKRLRVILNREKRIWAVHTDVLEFLLGKLLENCDPDYYFVPEIRGLVLEKAPDFFRKFVKLTAVEVRKQGEDPDKVLSVIENVIVKMGKESIAGDQQTKWTTLNAFHQQAFRNARSVFRSEMRETKLSGQKGEPLSMEGFERYFEQAWQGNAHVQTHPVPPSKPVGKYLLVLDPTIKGKDRVQENPNPKGLKPVRVLDLDDFNFNKIKEKFLVPRGILATVAAGDKVYYMVPPMDLTVPFHTLMISESVRPNVLTAGDMKTSLDLAERNPRMKFLQNTDWYTVNHLHIHVTTIDLPVEKLLPEAEVQGTLDAVKVSKIKSWQLTHAIFEDTDTEKLTKAAMKFVKVLQDAQIPHWTAMMKGRVIVSYGEPNGPITTVGAVLGENHSMHVLESLGAVTVSPDRDDLTELQIDQGVSAASLNPAKETELLSKAGFVPLELEKGKVRSEMRNEIFGRYPPTILLNITKGSPSESELGLLYSKLKYGDPKAVDYFSDRLIERIRDDLGSQIGRSEKDWVIVSLSGVRLPNGVTLFSRKISDALGLPHYIFSQRLLDQGVAANPARQARYFNVGYTNPEERSREVRFIPHDSPGFEGSIPLKGKKVILLDDSFMTGSVLAKSLELLEREGATRIQPYALVRLEGFGDEKFENKIDTTLMVEEGTEAIVKAINAERDVMTVRPVYSLFYKDRGVPRPPEEVQTLLARLTPQAKLTLYLYGIDYLAKDYPQNFDLLVKALNKDFGEMFPGIPTLNKVKSEKFLQSVLRILERYQYRVPYQAAPQIAQKLSQSVSLREEETARPEQTVRARLLPQTGNDPARSEMRNISAEDRTLQITRQFGAMPRREIVEKYGDHFDESGQPLSELGVSIALVQYQAALNEAVTGLRQLWQEAGIPLKNQGFWLAGSFASRPERTRIGLLLKQNADVAAGLRRGKKSPSDLDLVIAPYLYDGKYQKKMDQLAIRIFEKYGILVGFYDGLLSVLVDINEVSGNGLIRRYLEATDRNKDEEQWLSSARSEARSGDVMGDKGISASEIDMFLREGVDPRSLQDTYEYEAGIRKLGDIIRTLDSRVLLVIEGGSGFGKSYLAGRLSRGKDFPWLSGQIEVNEEDVILPDEYDAYEIGLMAENLRGALETGKKLVIYSGHTFFQSLLTDDPGVYSVMKDELKDYSIIRIRAMKLFNNKNQAYTRDGTWEKSPSWNPGGADPDQFKHYIQIPEDYLFQKSALNQQDASSEAREIGTLEKYIETIKARDLDDKKISDLQKRFLTNEAKEGQLFSSLVADKPQPDSDISLPSDSDKDYDKEIRNVLHAIGENPETVIATIKECMRVIQRWIPAHLFSRFYKDRTFVSGHGFSHSLDDLLYCLKIIKAENRGGFSAVEVDPKALCYAVIFHDLSNILYREHHDLNSIIWMKSILKKDGSLNEEEIKGVMRVLDGHLKKLLQELSFGAKLLHDADNLSAALDPDRIYALWKNKAKIGIADTSDGPGLGNRFYDPNLQLEERIASMNDGKHRIDGLVDLAWQFLVNRGPEMYKTKGAQTLASDEGRNEKNVIEYIEKKRQDLIDFYGFKNEDIEAMFTVIHNLCAALESSAPDATGPARSEIRNVYRRAQTGRSEMRTAPQVQGGVEEISGGTGNGERGTNTPSVIPETSSVVQDRRSEVRGDRTDRMVKAIRKGTQTATVFVDAEDFPNLSVAQKNEYFYAALSGRGVRIVVYNERGRVQDKELGALLKLDRVTRTDRDLAGAQISFDRPGTPNIHLSKKILPSQKLVQRLRKRVSFFKTQGQNGGTLAAALLWAWSGGEDARLREISQGRDGFWIVAESFVNALQRSYNATLAFAVAA